MQPADLEPVRALEDRAGALFHQVGKPDIAAHPVPPASELIRYVHAGQAWVLETSGGTVAGFVFVSLIDGLAHIEQVSIDPAYAGKRFGSALIDHVEVWAAACDLPALTLTTFREVPWNAPYYARLGFSEIVQAGPELTELMSMEAEHGLDPAERVAMIRAVDDVSRGTSSRGFDGFPPGDLL